MSRFSAQIVRPNGTTRKMAMYGTMTTAGASVNTHESAAFGMTSSFWMNFTPSAISCAHPWKRPAYIGPSRCCI